MAVVSHDKVDRLKVFADKNDIVYTLLSDADAKIIPDFGLANPQFKKGSPWYGVALPIIFVVDPDGTIRHRFSRTDYRERVDPDLILGILKKDAAKKDGS